jgi:hypothetical protein
MNKRIRIVIAALILIFTAQCAAKMAVPPAINLMDFEVVGLVDFDCNEQGELDDLATQRFLEYIMADQLGVRILELGAQDALLRSVGHDDITPEAIRAIGERHHTKTLLIGTLTVDDVKPKVNLSTILSSLSVRAEVQATLSARMVDCESGATMWTESARGKETVGSVSAFSDGSIFFDAEDPEESYGHLVDSLVDWITTDFRVTWQRVKK